MRLPKAKWLGVLHGQPLSLHFDSSLHKKQKPVQSESSVQLSELSEVNESMQVSLLERTHCSFCFVLSLFEPNPHIQHTNAPHVPSAPHPSHRTYGTAPIAPHPRTHRTAPTYPSHRTHLPIAPHPRTRATHPWKACVRTQREASIETMVFISFENS